MKTVKVKFECNAGHTTEIVDVKIFDGTLTEEEQIDLAFKAWVDNNEDCCWEKVEV
jgi:hypothetical protein